MADRGERGFTIRRTLLVSGSVLCTALVVLLVSAGPTRAPAGPSTPNSVGPQAASVQPAPTPEAHRLADSAVAQVGVTTSYESAYVHLDYPGGDVPHETGVCADVIVRAFRGIGIDLQLGVHEDMSAHLEEYPQPFGVAKPDSNIDHRRVNNLQTYFTRRGMQLPVSIDGADYLPGDVVTWTFLGYPHIGIVSAEPALIGGRYKIVHNIGRGVRVEDVLFQMEITGHYRWR
jgi:uncharacterized protein